MMTAVMFTGVARSGLVGHEVVEAEYKHVRA